MADQEQDRTAEDDAADLAAGFEAARQGHTSTPPRVEAEAEVTDEGSEAEEETQAPEPEIEGLGMTATKLREQLGEVQTIRSQFEQAMAKAHGKIGELNRTIQELRERKPTGGPGKINEDALKRLKEEYGDDLADTVANLFVPAEPAQVAATQPAGTQQPPADLSTLFEERLQNEVGRLTGDFNVQLLTITHPDWSVIKDSPELEEWERTLDPRDQHELRNSTNAVWLAQQLTKFKDWRKQKSEAQSEQERARTDKARRLEASVVPQGVQGSAQTKSTNNDFEAGFWSARGT